jgi:radical SAM protein with 4Fe4S-binding SPASM domain
MTNSFLEKVKLAVKTLITRKVTIELDRIPYHIEKMSLKKILNWIFIEICASLKTKRSFGFPVYLQIEPTNHCNLRCIGCPVTIGMGRPGEHMNVEVFKKLMDEIGNYVFTVTLWDWGEPFLNPHVFEIIKLAKQKKIKVVSSTNGHLLKKIDHCDKIIESGLDSLIIALDGITQETYERFRYGGKLETVLEGIRTLVARKRLLNSKIPFINLRFIVMKYNEYQIPDLKNLADDYGVDALSLKTFNPCAGGVLIDRFEDLLPEAIKYRRFIDKKTGQFRVKLKNNPCKVLWNNPTIHSNGKVCLCSYDYTQKQYLGDLKTESFKRIWNNSAYQNLRSQYRINYEKIEFCNECTYAYAGGNCYGESIAEVYFMNQ